jgi:glucose-1-phosphate cytidylyltransferase
VSGYSHSLRTNLQRCRRRIDGKSCDIGGGLGTRFAEETDVKPKPMITAGPYPIIWHIMKIFSSFGLEEFYVATGYKGGVIKRYFADYHSG